MQRFAFMVWMMVTITSTQSMAQGFLKKLENKVGTATASKANTATSGTTGSTTGEDPAKYGKPIWQFKSDMETVGDGSAMVFVQAAYVTNNQLHLKIAINSQLYEYTNGALQPISGTPNSQAPENRLVYCERDLQGKEFASADASASMVNQPHIVGPMVPGKINRDYTFNGKLFTQGQAWSMVHNYDSSVVLFVGYTFAKGMEYYMASSRGLHQSIPSLSNMGLISPDGNTGGAFIQKGMGGDVYTTKGNKITLTTPYTGDGTTIWLRNTGNVFCFNSSNTHQLLQNDKPYYTFPDAMPTTTNDFKLFISADENRLAWSFISTLNFSDGTVFTAIEGPRRLTIDNKEVILFLARRAKDHSLYLCQKEL